MKKAYKKEVQSKYPNAVLIKGTPPHILSNNSKNCYVLLGSSLFHCDLIAPVSTTSHSAWKLALWAITGEWE